MAYRDDSINRHLNNRKHDHVSLRGAVGQVHWPLDHRFSVERRADQSLVVTLCKPADTQIPMPRTVPDAPAQPVASMSTVRANSDRNFHAPPFQGTQYHQHCPRSSSALVIRPSDNQASRHLSSAARSTSTRTDGGIGICTAYPPGRGDTLHTQLGTEIAIGGIPHIHPGPPEVTLPRNEGCFVPPPAAPCFPGYYPYAIPEILMTGTQSQAPSYSPYRDPPYPGGVYPYSSAPVIPLVRHDLAFPPAQPRNFADMAVNRTLYRGAAVSVESINNGYYPHPSLSARNGGASLSAMHPRNEAGVLYGSRQIVGGINFQPYDHNEALRSHNADRIE